ncbi:D-isomer specific 2-hydroxyacid dehydrogenase [Dunaliella salina]|uniref:D-isomer specific 2-hydroxyacid dehydrogenase n=1 Tax=Dunaliella salina TaxID=3046 RepID=A0ABQ7GZI4_DUNSA|nr:D-isomer specific 2-hydroxyacid dehydrogenase [Dunaliella salina]|eukprot:KAF5840020.1 D-isomer specific 2-hydroxyacid dehydrogenase [Dunaliella salina]
MNEDLIKSLRKSWSKEAAWPHLSNVKWIHTLYTGLEQLSFSEAAQSNVIVTNSKGVYSSSLAEYALAACSWFAKDLPRLQRAKAERKWDPYEVEELRGKTMGVVGYGDIGQACARLARAFKMHVVGLRRRAELSEEEKQEGLVDAMYTPSQLTELMSQSDYVVMSTPLTPQTEKLVNAAAIAAMKPNAVFINIGRGKCVDEEALIKALKSRRIRGAGLDVFATEPLPTESELWRLDNVLISPHCADRTAEFQEEAMELFLTNVKRWLSHQPLQNVVDKAASIQLCC